MIPENSNLSKLVKSVVLILIMVIVYLVIAIPFKVMSVIPGFTDIRPVELLKPVYGIFFGIPGCIAFAVGNLIGDIMSDSLRWSSIAGFAANFLGPFVFFVFCKYISKTYFCLRKGTDILKQLAVIAISGLVEASIIAPAVKLIYNEIDILLLFSTVFLNGVVFPVLFGIPLIILMQEELGFKPVINNDKRITG